MNFLINRRNLHVKNIFLTIHITDSYFVESQTLQDIAALLISVLTLVCYQCFDIFLIVYVCDMLVIDVYLFGSSQSAM